MTVKIRAEPVVGRDLRPGDLFSTAGPAYWDQWDQRGSCGERVYVRTNAPADLVPDADETIYRVTVVRCAPYCDFCHGDAGADPTRSGGVTMCADCFAVFEQACTPREVNP